MDMRPAATPPAQKFNDARHRDGIWNFPKIETSRSQFHPAGCCIDTDIGIAVVTGEIASLEADKNLAVTDQDTLPLNRGEYLDQLCRITLHSSLRRQNPTPRRLSCRPLHSRHSACCSAPCRHTWKCSRRRVTRL